MARAERKVTAGSIHHVHNRGALRRTLFVEEADWRLFVGTLRDALERHEVDLFAWCLMPNHWHLLLRTTTATALPAFVRWLTLAHSRRRQALHGETGLGTLYQGRYRSHLVDGDGHLLAVLRYVERNPVRAGLVGRAVDWPWSSVRERVGGGPGLLAALPMELPRDWAVRLDAPETAGEMEALRARLGRPVERGRAAVSGR